jgi:hypothetical protein
MATMIRRTDKHEQLSFRVQGRHLAPSSENSMSIRIHTLESKENVTLPPVARWAWILTYQSKSRKTSVCGTMHAFFETTVLVY